MPGNYYSPYWSAMDFDSEDDDLILNKPLSSRVYVDPWDVENYAFMRRYYLDSPRLSKYRKTAHRLGYSYLPSYKYSSSLLNPYYLPSWYDYDTGYIDPVTKEYYDLDSYGLYELFYGRDSKFLPRYVDRRHSSAAIYEQKLLDEQCSVAGDAPLDYGTPPVPPPRRKRRMSMPQPTMTAPEQRPRSSRRKSERHNGEIERGYSDYTTMPRKSSANYEAPLMEKYPMMFRPPDNFHMSPHGHLAIDYSSSWNSLDRLIRSQR